MNAHTVSVIVLDDISFHQKEDKLKLRSVFLSVTSY